MKPVVWFSLFYVYGCFTCMYVGIPCACLVPMGVRKRALDPWDWNYKRLWATVPCWCWGPNPGPMSHLTSTRLKYLNDVWHVVNTEEIQACCFPSISCNLALSHGSPCCLGGGWVAGGGWYCVLSHQRKGQAPPVQVWVFPHWFMAAASFLCSHQHLWWVPVFIRWSFWTLYLSFRDVLFP